METIDAACGSTHRENIACTSRHPWFRKSKSETETLQRGRLMSTGAVTASSQTSHASSSSSTAASGALHRRTDTMSSSSSHDIARTRAATSLPVLVKHAAVQCLLLSDNCNTTTTLPDEKVTSAAGLMCVDMEAIYRGSSHQRRKAIVIAATGDETLLQQRPINYR